MRAVLIIGLCGSLAAPVAADTIVALDSGFINSLGRTSKYDGAFVPGATFNYSCGAIDDPPLGAADVPRKNFFVFSLGSVSGTITAATLKLYNPGVAADGFDGFSTPDIVESYSVGGSFPMFGPLGPLASDLGTIWPITSPPALAYASSLYPRVAESLGMGPAFGSVVLSPSDNGTTVSIPFGAAGLTYLNTFAGGTVVLGGALTSLNGVTGPDEFAFGYSAPIFGATPMPILELTIVPAPGTAFAVGVAGLGLTARRRRFS